MDIATDTKPLQMRQMIYCKARVETKERKCFHPAGRPIDGEPYLVWVEADVFSVRRDRDGWVVNFCGPLPHGSGCSGWYPLGNIRLLKIEEAS